MPKYKYTAISATGEKSSGEHVAPDQESVVDMLRQGGYYPQEIKMIQKDVKKNAVKIPAKVLASYCTQMSTLLRAGVPISSALEILTAQQEHPKFKGVLEDVYGQVLRGIGLSDSFKPYENSLPALFVNMIEAGEAAGTLDSCLDRAGKSFMRIAKLNSRVRNAAIYPSIILVVLFGLLALMLVVVLPAFSEMYTDAGAELPGFTQVMLNISDFVRNGWAVILGIIIIVAVVFIKWKQSTAGKLAFDRFKLRIPKVSNLLAKVYAARFSRTLASLGAAGVPLGQSLDVTARSIMNTHIEKQVYACIDGINRGELLSSNLEKIQEFPPMIAYMTRLGEESGTMEDLLEQVAEYYDEESETAMQALTAMLEPMLIILMAIIIVPVLIGVLLPMFNMHDMLM